MGYALLWVLSLVLSLVLTATACSLTSGLRIFGLRAALPALVFLALSILGVFLSVASWELNTSGIRPEWLFNYFLSWTVIYTILAILILRKGIAKKQGEDAMKWSSTNLVLFFGIMLTLLAGVFVSMDNNIKSKLLSAQADAAISMMALKPDNPFDHNNAAVLLNEANDIIELMAGEKKKKYPKFPEGENQPGFNPGAGEVGRFLQKYSDYLTAVRRAANAPAYYYFQTGKNSMFNLYIKIEKFSVVMRPVRFLALEMRYKAAQGEFKAALENAEMIEKLAEHLSRSLSTFTTLFSGSIYQIRKRALENSLADVPQALEEVIPYIQHNKRNLNYEAFQRSLEWRIAVIPHEIISAIIRGSLPLTGNTRFNSLFIPAYRVFLATDDMNSIYHLLSETRRFAEKPVYEIYDDLLKWEKDFDKNPGGLFAATAFAHESPYFLSVNMNEANRRLFDLALASAAYKAKTGAYPSDMDQLVPEYISDIPKDPFDGKPLKVASVEGGLTIYSIGSDFKDDGGAEYSQKDKTGDITFHLGSAYNDRRLNPVLEKKARREKSKKSKRK